MIFRPGTDIGRYHIIDQIGEGGMAIVYKAFDTHLESEVAVKVIRLENLPGKDITRALKRFQIEAKKMAQLAHSNIIRVLDYGEFEDTPYLVMPFIPSGTLKKRLGVPVNSREAARLLLPVASALAYAHSRDLVHRDVKPGNILITESGDPMLTDFGITKVLISEETLDLTTTGMGVGTPGYMSPEQAEGKPVDGRSDIYSLGIIMYELVAGRKPFVADTPMGVIVKQIRDPLPRPSQYVGDIPEEVEQFLYKSLAKDPADRFQTMDELVKALQKIEKLPIESTVRQAEKPPLITAHEQVIPEKKQTKNRTLVLSDQKKKFNALSLFGIFVVVAVVIGLVFGLKKTDDFSSVPIVEEVIPVVINWNIGADPKTIDPGLNGASDGGDVINQTFEGLFREKNGVVQPGIAKDFDVSEDGLTYTFNLRKSNWSDGSPLTAHDFEYAWERAMDPATASEYSWLWEYTNVVGAYDFVIGEGTIDGVGIKVLDDYTLEVKLIAPTDYFPSLMSFYHFMPVKQSAVEAGADGTWASNPELAVSNGPFKLVEYTIGDGLKLVKNENYWNAKDVKIAEINGKFIDDANTAYAAYQAGDLDFIFDVPVAEISRLIAEDPNFYIFPLLGTYYYNFNMDLDLWADARVRRALTLGIDRQKICDTLASGQVPAAGFISPGFADDKGNDFFETSGTYGLYADGTGISEAQQLLADAGYPGGEGFPEFTILYNTSEGHQAVAELVQEDLKTNLGLNVKLANQEWAVFQDTRTQGDFEMARGGWLTDFMDPSGMLAIFQVGNAYNDPNYFNADYEAAMDAALATTDKAEHFKQLYIAQGILMTDLPIIPVYHYSDTMLVSDKVVGWDRSVLGGIDFSTATVIR